MKKIKLFLILFVCTPCILSAQYYNSVNNYHFCWPTPDANFGGCGTFQSVNGNWEIAQGSPQYGTSTMFMWSHDGIGEGIFQNNVFPISSNYSVKIGIKGFFKSGDGQIYVYATSGLSASTGNCGEAPPNPPAKRLIGVYSGGTVGNFEWTVNSNFVNDKETQLWIYPMQTNNGGGVQTNLFLDYVLVCATNGTTQVFGCGDIPDGVHHQTAFKVGTSFMAACANNMVNNIGNLQTILHSSTYTTIQDNTLLTADEGGYFLIDHLDFPFCQSTTFDAPCDISKPGKDPTNVNGAAAKSIAFYPNPNVGNFIVQLPDSKSYILKVFNAMGTLVQEEELRDSRQKHILLDKSIPSGVYIIQVVGEGFKYSERMTIDR